MKQEQMFDGSMTIGDSRYSIRLIQMRVNQIQLDLLWRKSQQTTLSDSKDLFELTQPMKVKMAQSMEAFRKEIQEGKLPQGYTPINKTNIPNYPIPRSPVKAPQKKSSNHHKEYLYKLEFQQRQRQQKRIAEEAPKKMVTKEQRSKEALAKLTIYNLPEEYSYKEDEMDCSDTASQSYSTKLITEDNDIASGYCLRRRIFKQLTSSNVVKKSEVIRFLKEHSVVSQLYNIPSQGIQEFVDSIKSEDMGQLSEGEFHEFLTSKHRHQRLAINKPECILGAEEWEVLHCFYDSLDIFGQNKVLKTKILTEMLKRYHNLQQKLFLKDCLLFPNVQRSYSFERVWQQIVHRETKDYWSWGYFQQLILHFSTEGCLSLDEIQYNHHFPRTYNLTVSGELIHTIKTLFKKEMIHYDLFVDNESLCQSLSADPAFRRHSNSFIRSNPINGLKEETVHQALQRLSNSPHTYVDLNGVLIHFTFNGMFLEDINEYKLSLFEKEDDEEFVCLRRQKPMKVQKMAKVTVPIEFKLSEPRVNAIRTRKVEEMLREKEEQVTREMENQFKAMDIPVTNDQKYHQYSLLRPKEDPESTQASVKKKLKETTMEELKRTNEERKENIRALTFEKYRMEQSQETHLQQMPKTILQPPSTAKKSVTIPQPFLLSSPKVRPQTAQPPPLPISSPSIDQVLKNMKKQVSVPLTAKFSQQLYQLGKKQNESLEKELKKRQEKEWKAMRKRQFSRHMHRSLPKIMTDEVTECRSRQVRKEYKKMQRRLLVENQQELSDIYKRVLQRPFLFQNVTSPKAQKKQTKLKKVSKTSMKVVRRASSKPNLDEDMFVHPPFEKSNINHQSTAFPGNIENDFDYEYPISEQQDSEPSSKNQQLMIESNQLPKYNPQQTHPFQHLDEDDEQGEESNQQEEISQYDQYEEQQEQEEEEEYDESQGNSPLRHSF